MSGWANPIMVSTTPMSFGIPIDSDLQRKDRP